MNPDNPPDFVTQVNFTVEQQFKDNSALRVTWLWSHGTNLDQEYTFNSHPNNFIWEMQTGTIPPTGGASTIGTNQYASTATGPYDKVTWPSGAVWDQKTGWSNDNALQVNYQRLFHSGLAYQIFYVWSKPFRVGGNYFRDGTIAPAGNYAKFLAGGSCRYSVLHVLARTRPVGKLHCRCGDSQTAHHVQCGLRPSLRARQALLGQCQPLPERSGRWFPNRR
jgi:hypothetical protein